jgi:hypothetical protein
VKCKKEFKSADVNNEKTVYPANCGFVTPEESANRGYSITNDYAIATTATRRQASDSFILKAARSSSTATHRRRIKSLQQLATESIYSNDATTSGTSADSATGYVTGTTDHHEAIAKLYKQLKALHVSRRKVRMNNYC